MQQELRSCLRTSKTFQGRKVTKTASIGKHIEVRAFQVPTVAEHLDRPWKQVPRRYTTSAITIPLKKAVDAVHAKHARKYRTSA